MNNVDFDNKGFVAPPEDRFEEKYSTKNRVTAGVLAILLGTMGVHDFYLGNTKKGIIHLIMFFTGIFSIASTVWSIYDGIMLFCGKINKDGEGNILL